MMVFHSEKHKHFPISDKYLMGHYFKTSRIIQAIERSYKIISIKATELGDASSGYYF